MRLLYRRGDGTFGLFTDPPDLDRGYAILSHTWLSNNDEEVLFGDLVGNTCQGKPGYRKLMFCAEQAARDGLQYLWVDTCCIDKKDSTELQEAITSMFRWYQEATKCYVYLTDVPARKRRRGETYRHAWEHAFRQSRWFTRGWTLQELLAPSSVEFFSKEGTRLGDRQSLRAEIHEITGIPRSALRGLSLDRFTVDERMSWADKRNTKRGEDKTYSLLGILNVSMPIMYGEGIDRARRRLIREIHLDSKEHTCSIAMTKEDRNCMQDLRSTDPRDDKKRIEEAKGGLLNDCYGWIIENSEFQGWRDNEETRLLWVKGNPGKGKTMLLCGIINELEDLTAQEDTISYFFCEATDSRINTATAVLRGLLSMIVDQQPVLISHIRKKYDFAGKALFEDANAWFAISDILTDCLEDPILTRTALIIDALDECVIDLPKLLDYIARSSSALPNVKWVISARNWPNIEKNLKRASQKSRLCLELNEDAVAAAVATYIRRKVKWLVKRNGYSDKARNAIQHHLLTNAEGTFLWVALVCKELADVSSWAVQQKLCAFPPGLDALYGQMLNKIRTSEHAELCKRILAVAVAVFRPITLGEMFSLIDTVDVSDDETAQNEIIGLCGSLLNVRNRIVSFVHQSARDFLLKEALQEIFPAGVATLHYMVYTQSVRAMSQILRRDVHNATGARNSTNEVILRSRDPLVTLTYSCVYWIDHLHEGRSSKDAHDDLQQGSIIDKFLRGHFLHWLEALGHCRSVTNGINSMHKLERLLQGRSDASGLADLVHDMRRFVMHYKPVIETHPLQTYVSAILFSPLQSLTRRIFSFEEPQWVSIQPPTEDKWDACLQTLEEHTNTVSCITYSPDGKRLASASFDGTVRFWDAQSGAALRTLPFPRSKLVQAVAFGPDNGQLTSASHDGTVILWNTDSGMVQQTLLFQCSIYNPLISLSSDSKTLAFVAQNGTTYLWDLYSGRKPWLVGDRDAITGRTAFAPNSEWVASVSSDDTVTMRDAISGITVRELKYKGNGRLLTLVITFSPDSRRLASTTSMGAIVVWDTASTLELFELEIHDGRITNIAFSANGRWLASITDKGTIELWDVGTRTTTWKSKADRSHGFAIVFSPDSKHLASASGGGKIKLWEVEAKVAARAAQHSSFVGAVAFSSDGTRLASASGDKTVRLWDATSATVLQVFTGHSDYVEAVALSSDGRLLASGSRDCTIRLWNMDTGETLQELVGHKRPVCSIQFSENGIELASISSDRTKKIWSLRTTGSGHSPSDAPTTKGSTYYTLERSISGVEFLAQGADRDFFVRSRSCRPDQAWEPKVWPVLLISGPWVRYKGRGVLWLPPEYRPGLNRELSVAVNGERVAIGHDSGRVSFLTFKLDLLSKQEYERTGL